MTAKKGMTTEKARAWALIIGAIAAAAATMFTAFLTVKNSGKLDQVHDIVNSTDTELRRQIAGLQETIKSMMAKELANEKAKDK